MIVNILSAVLFLIFMILSGFHFFWLFGGTWGLRQAIPTREKDLELLSIPKYATLLVALVLALFGLIYLNKLEVFNISNQLTNLLYYVIPILFLIRAIGEFNYVGFFKKIKHTEFAKADTKLFSPLCLSIGLIGLIIQFLTNYI
ncbi:DUF3995 domain-containing protein [Maribacter sp. 1_MG-2023]|uniref:DUF3995 domain-containing protein n=1 Tax=Maribacter sp. 1_MG-2023 TaxID=3062677 RepID=UPI0026E403E2|nr:DUF3995 domain-containing protein [Maribacter sp. 1_MG-2023]MDO6473297.1 DUF3995 domain-containing protein [Maribacter sp. 1_MG-2023]